MLKDGKTAVFLLSSDATATGDGHCRPSAKSCQTIEVKEGDTEFFDLTVNGEAVQYQLDVVQRLQEGRQLRGRRGRRRRAPSNAGADLLRRAHQVGSSAFKGAASYRWLPESGVLVRAPQARQGARVGQRRRRRLAGRRRGRLPGPAGLALGRRRLARRSAIHTLRRPMALKLITAGESHGPGLTCVVEGLPAGLELDREAIDRDMARRQLGHGRGGRMKIERDSAEVTGGVRHGRTLGGPIALQVANRDFANWEERMNPWPVEAEVAEVHLPRPGHADLVGTWKYRLTDVRNVLERASARETAARVAGGALAKAFLRALGVEVRSHVVQIGSVQAPARDAPLRVEDFEGVDDDPVRCLDRDASRAMVEHINVQRKANESIGGVFEVIAFGVDARARLARRAGRSASTAAWPARCARSRPSRASTIGDGFDVAGRPGSEAHDEIFFSEERGFYRETNHAGGLEGGMTTGEPRRRARGDEAAADADQAAALGRHRHARARRGAARAHRLRARSRRPAWWGRRWSPSSSPTPTARSSAATTSTTCSRRCARYEERIGWRRR